MRIKNQLRTFQFLFGLLVVAMFSSAWAIVASLKNAVHRVEVANSIVQASSDLAYLTSDCLIFPEPLHLRRWESKYAEFLANIGNLEGENAGEAAVGADLLAKARLLHEVFADLGSGSTYRQPNDEGALRPEMLRLAWSRVSIQSLGLMSGALQISRLVHDRRDSLFHVVIILFFLVTAIFVIYFLVPCILLIRRILRSIEKLRNGTSIVGSGDFGHRIEVERDDEIGDLTKAFNSLTEETMKRSAEREAAERELLEHRANLERTVEVRTQALVVAMREAEEANRLKSSFLANMSHELRTPLNSIIGFTEVLEDRLYGELNEKQREYLAYISTSGKHLLELINDILDLAKIESGKMDIAVSRFRLRQTLELSLAMLRERAMRHSITLTMNLSPEADVEIVSDERKIKQVLFNLLSNAVKFTPDGGEVRLEAWRSKVGEGFVELSVTDTGIGIKEEDMGRLFVQFAQLDAPLEKRFEGTGLGLALSKRLIESLGGRIQARSELGKGSVFSIAFPIVAPSADGSGGAEEGSGSRPQ